MISDEMLDNRCQELYRFKTPEELFNGKREIASAYWDIGIMIYEAHFKQNPFATSLNSKVSNFLIQKYPLVFPKSMMFVYKPELNECV